MESEAAREGEVKKEIALAGYVCHAAGLANNELSGPVVLTALVQWWQEQPRRHTLRVLLAPETIGALCFLSRDGMLAHLKQNLKAGLTLTCMGGPGSFALQLGRQENYASRIARHVLGHEYDAEIRPWGRRGSDERQFTAPGIDLPWATVMKTPPGSPLYPQYHRSDDDLSYVTEEQLQESLALMKKLLTCIEADRPYRTLVLGEPMLSKRNLMPTLSRVGSSDGVRSMMTSWSYCDGRTLLENAEAQGRPMWDVKKELDLLETEKLVEAVK